MKRKSEVGIVVITLFICAVFILMPAVQSVTAREIAGVNVPPSVTIDNNVLVLNGAGIRKKFIVKIYVGALYLPAKRSTVKEILNGPGPKSIVLSFLYKKLSVEDVVDGWNSGFINNNSSEELLSLQDRINQFNSLFSPVLKGDVIRMNYVPEEGTQVWINDTLKGTVPGEDFQRALLKIWLGPKPVDAGLKDDMLGDTY